MSSKDLDQDHLSTLTVLLVEDDPMMQRVVAQLLQDNGLKVLLAGNGREGLEQFERHQPDFVVTDILMPVMSGLEMAEALRAQDRLEPIIAVTGSDRPGDMIRSIEVGIDRYVLKPVQAGQLRQALLHCAHILRERTELQRSQAEAGQLQAELQAANARLRLDLAERQASESRIRSLVKLHSAVSQTNQAILRVHDKQALFQKICAIATEFGGFPLAWIGLKDPGNLELKVAARSGTGSILPYLDGIKVSLDPESPFGRGPTGTATRQGSVVICQAFQESTQTEAWREQALRFGLCSSAAFPFRGSGQVIGSLTVYEDRPHFFDDQRVALLTELSDSLSFALDHLELEVRRDRAEARILDMNAALEGRVQEQAGQARLLAAANRELESFSYSVSHDLRAPLRSVDGFSQMLREDFGDRLGAEGLDCLDRVQAAAKRMGAIIEDLLRLSQVGRGDLEPAPLDLAAPARRILEALALADPARKVRTVLAASLPATGDSRLLALALENLLGNAWKYTGRTAEARIEFGCAPQGGEPVFFVRDNGVGFDMAQAGELFGAFQRLHSSRDFEGTGVGLAIVQRIIQRHGGRIWAEAVPGTGATFFFTLPA